MQTTDIDIIQVVEVVIALAATYLIARIVSELSSEFLRRHPFQRALRAPKCGIHVTHNRIFREGKA